VHSRPIEPTIQRVSTMAKKNSRLAAGSKVFLRKPKTPGIIRAALGPKKWQVELLDVDNYSPTGIVVELTSAALRHPYEDEFKEEDDGNDGNEEAKTSTPDSNIDIANNESIELVLQDVAAEEEDDESEEEASEEEDDPLQDQLFALDLSEIVETDGPPQLIDASDIESEAGSVVEEDDPDLELAEDVPSPCLEEAVRTEEANFNAADFLAARGIEVDEDRHKTKWDRYLLEKKFLVDQQWTIACKPPKQSIEIGSRLKEKGGQGRLDIIIGSDRQPEDKGPFWSVLFAEAENPEQRIPSQKLVLVKDKRIFHWKAVESSTSSAIGQAYQHIWCSWFPVRDCLS
jgi:hypothetical protein